MSSNLQIENPMNKTCYLRLGGSCALRSRNNNRSGSKHLCHLQRGYVPATRRWKLQSGGAGECWGDRLWRGPGSDTVYARGIFDGWASPGLQLVQVGNSSVYTNTTDDTADQSDGNMNWQYDAYENGNLTYEGTWIMQTAWPICPKATTPAWCCRLPFLMIAVPPPQI